MLKIRKLGVLKMALFTGLFSFFIGLISAILMWILANVLGRVMFAGVPEQVGTVSLLSGLSFTSLILIPIGYGVFGFITGLIFTPVMNLIFKIINGLDIIIEEPEEPSVTKE